MYKSNFYLEISCALHKQTWSNTSSRDEYNYLRNIFGMKLS